MQCIDNTAISSEIWPVPSETTFDIDDELRLRNAMPTGPPGQNHPARPNVWMFDDWGFQADRTEQQEERFRSFQQNSLRKGVSFVVIEIGAGTKGQNLLHQFPLGKYVKSWQLPHLWRSYGETCVMDFGHKCALIMLH